MKQEEFSAHLLKLTPDVKRLIGSLKKGNFFGVHDLDDLYQEVMMHLWIKVPPRFDQKKGDLKKYCMTVAYRCIKRIAMSETKTLKNLNVDWREGIDSSFMKLPDELRYKLLKATKIDSKKDVAIMRVNLREIAESERDFFVIKLLYQNGGNRKVTGKIINRSNAWITGVFNRIREKYSLKFVN